MAQRAKLAAANQRIRKPGFTVWPYLGMAATLIIAVGLFFALQAQPNGASAEEVPDLSSSSVQSMLDKLNADTDSAKYLIDNASTVIPQLITELNALNAELSSGKSIPGDVNKAKTIVPLMLTDLNGIQTNVATNLPVAQKDAADFVTQKAALDTALQVTSPLAGTSSNGVPVLKQNDGSPDTLLSYGSGKTIKTSGCAVVSSTMVLQFYKKAVTIKTIRDFSLDNGYRIVGQGTSHGIFPALAKTYGLNYKDLTGNWDGIIAALKNHQPVIVSGKSNGHKDLPFTTAGHFVVLTGINSDGSISVNDPYHANGSYSQDHLKAEYHFAALMSN